MSQTAKKVEPYLLSVVVEDDKLRAEISDGRIVLVPVSWFPRLANASEAQRKNVRIMPSGYGAHWPDVDEDISIKAFIS
jgi:hypothetical protein